MAETTVFLDERSRLIWEGRRARSETNEPVVSVRGTTREDISTSYEEAQEWSGSRPDEEVSRPEAEVEALDWAEEVVRYLVAQVAESNFGERRGWSLRQTEHILGVARKTLQRWRSSPSAFATALRLHGPAFAARLVCMFAPPPYDPLPAVPMTMRIVRKPLPQLEVRAAYDALTTIHDWAARVFPALTLTRHNVRMTVRGSLRNVEAMRDALMRVERWLTVTPTDADVARWIGGES